MHKYAYIPNNELKLVASKFDEYSSFQIDTDELELWIRENFYSNDLEVEKYRSFIDLKMPDENSQFPLSLIKENWDYYNVWAYNKRLGIVKAYKSYLKILNDRKSYDFNLLQIKTRDKLKEIDKSKIYYKNILVDEFQDIDNIQFEIFELLSAGSESITYVGDINQSIYWWRGANPSNFKKLLSREDFEVKELLTNYRSPKNIVKLNNHFMVDKMQLKANNQNYGDLYYLNSKNREEQAKKIVNILKHLKDENKIKNFSDVCLLFRYTTMHHIRELLRELKSNNIKFNIPGVSDFENYPEVECVLLLLWYLSNEMPYRDIFKISEFARDELNNEMFNFNESTLKILNAYEGSPSEFTHFNETKLKEIGITNLHDLTFFTRLNHLKENFHSKLNEYGTKIDLLGLYYELLNITSYTKNKLNEIKFNDNEVDSNVQLLNLALFSRKINDFMETVDRFDIDNLFDFLFSSYKEYSSPNNSLDNEDCVQILSIHKSKGLEFPVVILCSLMEWSFPRREPLKEEYYTFPTPKEFKYKEIFQKHYSHFNEEFLKAYTNEERRVLYVGLTRAKSTLIVSHIKNRYNAISKEFSLMRKVNSEFTELNSKNMYLLSNVESKENKYKQLEFSFTSLENYIKCPQKYNLIHNYDFVSPQNISMRIGTIIHAVLDKINRELINNHTNELNESLYEEIINEAIESNSDLKDNEIFLDTLFSVKNFYSQIGVEFIGKTTKHQSSGVDYKGDDEFIHVTIKESEYPFTIPWYDGKLKGSIDLIMDYGDDKISLIDFKTSDEESIAKSMERYKRQLHFYYMAMDYNSKYKTKKENTLLKLYSLKDNTFVPVDIDEVLIDELNHSLLYTSENIRNKNYCESSDENSCNDCLIRKLCGR